MRKLYLLTFFCLNFCGLFAQNAKVQFIHNSPIPGTNEGVVMDLYINDSLYAELDSFTFKKVTTFLDIAPNDTSVAKFRLSPSTQTDPPVAVFLLGALKPDSSYMVVVSGIYPSIPGLPFINVYVNRNIPIQSQTDSTFSLNFFHGGILVPPIKIVAQNEGTLFQTGYATYTEYAELEEKVYYLDVDIQNIGFLLTYKADLTGFAGKACTLIANGIAIGIPEFGICIVCQDGSVTPLPLTPIARVQWVNNSPESAYDIYLEDEKIVSDLGYLEATEFDFLPADELLDFSIAPAGSSSADEAVDTIMVGFENAKSAVIALNGQLDHPEFPLSAGGKQAAREKSLNPEKFEFTIGHAAPGIEAVQVSIKDVGQVQDSLDYNAYTVYQSADTGTYYIDFKEYSTGDLLRTFIIEVPESYIGKSMTMLLNGTLESDQEITLWGVFADGTMIEFESLGYSRIQLIHNSQEDSVDVFFNTEIYAENLMYRTATKYLLIPSGIDVAISVRPTGVAFSEPALLEETYIFEEDVDYILVLSGKYEDTVDSLQWSLLDHARILPSDANKVDLIAFNGGKGIDSIDMVVRDAFSIFQNVQSYSFADYVTIDPLQYLLDINETGNQDVLYSFFGEFDLYTGKSITLITSGIVDADPSYTLLGVLSDGTVFELDQRSFSYMQFINNAAQASMDVYLNDTLYLDNFNSRSATGFIAFDADMSNTFSFAPVDSDNADDAFYSIDISFEGGKNYILLATGSRNNAMFPFEVLMRENARQFAQDLSSINLSFVHAAPVSQALTFTTLGGDIILDSLAYRNYSEYMPMDASYYLFRGLNAVSGDTIDVYEIDSREWAGQAITVVARGYLSSSEFELMAVLNDGSIHMLPTRDFTKLQFINASVNGPKDFYLNGNLWLEDFDINEATPFLEVVADRELEIALCPADSQSDEEFEAAYILNLPENTLNTLYLAGGVDEIDVPYEWHLNSFSRDSASVDSLVDINIFHAAHTLPALDIYFTNIGTWADSLVYTKFSNYRANKPDTYYVDIFEKATAQKIKTFYIDLSDQKGEALHFVLKSPDSDSTDYKLLAVQSDGTVLEFSSVNFTSVQFFQNIPSQTLDLYVDGFIFLDGIDYLNGTGFLSLPAGIPLQLEWAPSGMEPVDSFGSIELILESDSTYLVVFNGLPDDDDIPLELITIDGVQTASSDDFFVGLAVFHGAHGLSPLDITFRTTSTLVQDIVYKDFVSYFELETGRYLIDIVNPLTGKIDYTFEANLVPFGGMSGVIFLSGFTDSDPGFGMYLLLEDGTVIPFVYKPLAKLQLIHNALIGNVDVYLGNDKIVTNMNFREATPFIELQALTPLVFGFAPPESTSVTDTFAQFSVILENSANYIAMASGIQDSDETPFDLRLYDQARTEALDKDMVDLLKFNGIPDQGPLDLGIEGGNETAIMDSLEFGSYQDYSGMPPVNLTLRLKHTDSTSVSARYYFSMPPLKGQAVSLFTSGEWFSDTPDFQIWVALGNGITFPLDVLTSNSTMPDLITSYKIYPNPANHTAHISLDLKARITDISIRMYDMNGKVVDEIKFESLEPGVQFISIPVSDKEPGMYKVLLNCKHGALSGSLLILR